MMVYVENPVDLGPSFELWATLVVPRHKVVLNDRVHLFGQILADSILIKNGFKGTDGAFIPYYPKRPVVNFANAGAFVSYDEKDTLTSGPRTGDPDTTWAKIPVTLDHVNGAPVTIYYHTEPVSAVATGTTAAGTKDFVPVAKWAGSVTITATKLSDTIRIPVLGDMVYESPESFRVVLDSVKNGDIDGEQIKIGQDIAVIVINDNEDPPGMAHLLPATATTTVVRSAKDVVTLAYKISLTEMDGKTPMKAYTGGATVIVTPATPIAPAATVVTDFMPRVGNGVSASATPGEVSVHVPAGDSTVTFYVDVPKTLVYSPVLNLKYRIGGVVGTTKGTIDTMVTGVIQGIPVYLDLVGGTAKNNSTSPVAMTVSLRSDETDAVVTPSVPVSYSWYTKDSTAKSGTHFTGTAATSAKAGTFTVGSAATATLNVAPIVVNTYDSTRYFYGIATPTSVLTNLGTKVATAVNTLTNGWPKMTIAVSPVKITRPLTDSVIKVPVALSQKTSLKPSYTYKAIPGGAVAGTDFVLVSGSSIASKTASQFDSIAVTIKGMASNVFDTTRHFKVVIGDWDNTSIEPIPVSVDTAVITILPRLSTVRLLVDDASADQSKVDSISFPVRLVDGTGAAVTSRIDLPYSFSTADLSARAGMHFQKADGVAGVLTAGLSMGTLSVDLIQTPKYDSTRHFSVELTPASWVTTARDQAIGTLVNGYAKPSLILGDNDIVRPKVTTGLPIKARLSRASAIDLPLTWITEPGSAVAGTDFVSVSAGTASIRDSVDLTVSILPRPGEYDTLRRFTVIATGADSNFAKAKDTGLARILPALGMPYLAVLPSSVEEGDLNQDSLMTFRVELRDSTGAAMTSRVGGSFAWKVQDSAVTAPLTPAGHWTASKNTYGVLPYQADYIDSMGTVNLAAGKGEATFAVRIPGNDDKQGDRVLSVLLSSPVGVRASASIAPVVALGTIMDDDSANVRAFFPVAKDTVSEVSDTVWVPVRLKPMATQPDSIVITVDARTDAVVGRHYQLLAPVSGGKDTLAAGAAVTSLGFKVVSGDTLFWVPVRILPDSVRTKDHSLFLNLSVLDGEFLKADPGRSQTELVIANGDSMPYLGFRDSVVKVARGGSTALRLGLSPVASDLDPSAQYAGSLRQLDTASSLPAWSLLVTSTQSGKTPAFSGQAKSVQLPFVTTNDGRTGPSVDMVLRLSSWNEARQPGGIYSLHDSVVVRLDSTPYSKVNFSRSAKDTLVVQDVAGQANVSLLLERSSWWKTAAGVKTDAVLPKDVFAVDTSLAFAPTDSVRSFVVRFGRDGKVASDRVFALHLSGLVRLQPGQDSILWVRIVNTNKLPVVKITSPAEGAKLGKKDLDSAGKVLVRWTVGGAAQAPSDTLLPEGPSTITRCYTDTAGNVGCDSVHVTLDTTAPVVTIRAISKDSGKTWIAVGPNDTPWVNKPGILVKWTSTDNGVETVHIDGETLKDSLTLVTRCTEDEVGNKGCGSQLVGLDQTPPKVWIVTPPVGSHWSSSCVQTTWYEQDGDRIVRHDTTFCFSTVGPVTITVNSAPDRAGNVGTATNLIYIDPNQPSSATYVDTDGDGRIDAVVVQYQRPWTDAMPTFDISYGGPGKNTTGSASVSYGTAGQTGTTMVYAGDTIRVVTGTAVLDASGNPVIQADGTPLYQSSTGTPLLDASGKQVVNAEGIPLWKVTGSSTAVDSSVLVVKLSTPFPYGWTSSTLTDLGVMHATVNTIDSTGKVVAVKVTDTFDIKDGVAPVILESRVIRTEDYKGKDTLIVQLSEVASVTKPGGTGIIEISKDGGKTWIAVDVESISSTGTVKIVLEPGQEGSPSPGVLIRLAGSVTDASGNTAASSTSPSVTVLGPQRPDLIKVTAPSTLLEVPANWGSQPVKGTFTFLTSDLDSNNLQAYRPGEGYTGNSAVTEVCPDIRLCAAFDLYVNRPSNTQLIIYDQVGTYVAKVVFSITSEDLAMIKRDKLDRARLRILWNLRDAKGSQVVSGVYLIRTVIRYTDTQDVGAKFDNFVIRYGVRVK